MKEEDARRKSLALVERSRIALVGSNGGDGFPRIKAMLKMETEGLDTVWFSTNTSSRRVTQFQRDPRACVYFVDFSDWMGLQLEGEMDVLGDPAVETANLARRLREATIPSALTIPTTRCCASEQSSAQLLPPARQPHLCALSGARVS